MQQHVYTPSDIANGNGLTHFNRVENIDATDDFIRQAVDQAFSRQNPCCHMKKNKVKLLST